MTLMLRAILIAPAAVLVFGTCAFGQEHRREVSDVHLRNDCRLAAQVLETGHPHPRYRWAVQRAADCSESGPPAYVKRWSEAADSADVRDLLSFSARIRDQRLVDQALAVARDRQRPDVVRVGAMLLLWRYVDPQSRIGLWDLQPQDSEHVRMIVGGRSPHALPQIEGAEPVTPNLASATLQLLRELAANEPSRPVQYAAARLAKTLEYRINRPQN